MKNRALKPVTSAARAVFAAETEFAREAQRLGRPVSAEDYRELVQNYAKLLRKASKIVRIGDATHNKLIKTEKKLSKTLRELKETQAYLVQQERLSALGEMSRGIAHDFNNSLQPIILAASMLEGDEEIFANKEFVKKYVQMILNTASEAAETVRRFARFYRPLGPGEKKEIDVRELIDDVINLTRPKWKDEALERGCTIKINTDFRARCSVFGLQSELSEALVNITFNAIAAIETKGGITFASHCDSDFVTIEISDTGAGMDEETQKRCMEPFYSTKLQRGSGLGLSTAYGIVRGHKGKIQIAGKKGKGTTVRVILPIFTEDFEKEKIEKKPEKKLEKESYKKPEKKIEKKSEKKEKTPTVVKTRRKRKKHPTHFQILVVDDEETLRNTLGAMLRRAGHDVTTASSGLDGWKKFQTKDFDIVITDHAMPEMSGDQLAKKIKEKNPEMPVIMLTGFGDLMKAQGQQPEGVDLLLSKPVAPKNLQKSMAELVRR